MADVTRVAAREWKELMDIEGFLALESSRLSPRTIENYRRYLGYLQAWLVERCLSVADLDRQAFDRFLECRKGWRSPNTKRNALEALKTYLRHYHEGHLLLEHSIRRVDLPPGRKMTQDKVDTLLRVLDTPSRADLQMRAIIWLLWSCWVRVSEVVSLRMEHLDLKKRECTVLAKGGRWQTKRISEDACRVLEQWLKVRKRLARPECPTVFVGIVSGLPLTRDGLRANFKRLSQRVGFVVSPHDFRRGGPCYATEKGMPDRIGMLQGGWKSHATYRRYTEGADLKAVDQWLPGNADEETDPLAGGPAGSGNAS